jgi:hypothetical protein
MRNQHKNRYPRVLWFDSMAQFEDLIVALQEKDKDFVFKTMKGATQ